MVNKKFRKYQKSKLKTLFLYKRSQLKFILFTTIIIGFSLFYYIETLALDEIANKFSFDSSSFFLQIPTTSNNNNTTKTLNNSELVFSNVTNITNNQKDSIYAQIVAKENYVYIVWEESVTEKPNEKNYDIYFIKSEDKGNNFENSTKITDYNFGESQIAVNESKVFIVWGGLDDKNINDIYFVQSDNNGSSFTPPSKFLEKIAQPKNNTNFTDKTNHPTNVEISYNNPAFIVWQDKVSQENHDIFITTNIKNNFQATNIVNLSNNTGISECPQIAVSKNYVYVVWEDITPGNHEILYTRGIIQ